MRWARGNPTILVGIGEYRLFATLNPILRLCIDVSDLSAVRILSGVAVLAALACLALVVSYVRLRRRTRAAADGIARAIAGLATSGAAGSEYRFGPEFKSVSKSLVNTRDEISDDTSRIIAIQRLSAGLITAESIQDVCDVADESLLHFIEPDSITFWVPAKAGGLECVAISGRAVTEFKNFFGMRADEDSLTSSVMNAGEAVVTFDPQNDERINSANRKIIAALGVEAVLLFPLLVTNRKIGVFSMSWTHPVYLSEAEVSIIELAAAHVALAVDRIIHEEQTSESAAKLRAMLYSVGEGLVTTDSGGHILNWNRAIASMTTRSETWARGKFAFEAIELRYADGNEVPKEENPFLAVLRDRTRAPEPEDGYLMATVDGWLPVRVAAAPVYEGRVLYGSVAVVRDIHVERELEEMRDSLISTVSHELKTPLTMVQGFAELLSEQDLSAADRELAVDQISVASQRLGDLIDDILSTAAIEAGRIELILEDVVIDDAVRAARSGFPAAELDRIRVESESPCVVRGDFDRIVQVLTNLIGNAVKYSPDGGDVMVRAREVDGFAEISVSDLGVGISPEELGGLFEKFYRTRDAKDRHISGTGLGLYISRHLAELHEGAIEVKSEAGRGSTFTMRLPIKGPKPTETSEGVAHSIREARPD